MSALLENFPCMEAPLEGKDIKPGKGKIIAFENIPKQIERDELEELYGYESMFTLQNTDINSNQTKPCSILESKNTFYDDDIFDMFVHHPALEVMQNPIIIRNIQQNQFADEKLNRRHQQEPQRFPTRFVQDRPIICYIPALTNLQNWRKALPSRLIDLTICWYHETLGHCGVMRLYDSIR